MTRMSEHIIGNQRPLRCQLCGEQIGLVWGDGDPDSSVVVARCYQCAAVEETEAILGEGEQAQREPNIEYHDGDPVCVGQWCCGCAEHPIGKPWGWNFEAWKRHYVEHHYDVREAIG